MIFYYISNNLQRYLGVTNSVGLVFIDEKNKILINNSVEYTLEVSNLKSLQIKHRLDFTC